MTHGRYRRRQNLRVWLSQRSEAKFVLWNHSNLQPTAPWSMNWTASPDRSYRARQRPAAFFFGRKNLKHKCRTRKDRKHCRIWIQVCLTESMCQDVVLQHPWAIFAPGKSLVMWAFSESPGGMQAFCEKLSRSVERHSKIQPTAAWSNASKKARSDQMKGGLKQHSRKNKAAAARCATG